MDDQDNILSDLEYFQQYLDFEAENANILLKHPPLQTEVSITTSILNLLHRRLIAALPQGAQLFQAYETQAEAALFSAVAATLRLHYNQCFSLLRYAADCMSVSLYALIDPAKIAEIEKSDGRPSVNAKKVFDHAVKWLETNEQEFSKKIKEHKDILFHPYGAHVAYGVIGFNVTIKKEQIRKSLVSDLYLAVVGDQVFIAADVTMNYIEALIRVGEQAGIKFNQEAIKEVAGLKERIENWKTIQLKSRKIDKMHDLNRYKKFSED